MKGGVNREILLGSRIQQDPSHRNEKERVIDRNLVSMGMRSMHGFIRARTDHAHARVLSFHRIENFDGRDGTRLFSFFHLHAKTVLVYE